MKSRQFNTSYDLLVIDQAPLFDDAMDACQSARKRIDQIKLDLHHFETRDIPAFDRWYNSTFGAYLTRMREASAGIAEKELYLETVRKRHWARFFGNSSGIYSESGLGRDESDSDGFCGMHARWDSGDEDSSAEDHVESDEDDGEHGPDGEEYRYEADGSYYDDEQDFHFSEDEDSTRRFEEQMKRGSEWRSWSYRGRSSRDQSRNERGHSRDSGRAREDEPRDSDEPESLSAEDTLRNRIKERYRILVRKLHPDLNPDLSAEEKNLWNQVQAAYQSKNLENLDILVALSDALTGRITEATSLHQLRRAAQEIDRLFAPLRKRLDEAQKHRAWKFGELRDRGPLHKTIEKEFLRDLASLSQKMNHLDSQISRFTRTARPTDTLSTSSSRL